MQIKIYKEPVYHIVIDDFLPEAQNKEIFEYLIARKDKYAAIDEYQRIDQSDHSSLILNMDQLYHLKDNQDPEAALVHRASSPILKWLDGLLYDEKWLAFLDAAAFPLNEMRYCDYWSTLVSRYGTKDHHMWHNDSSAGDSTKLLTLTYYIHHPQKQFTGGEHCLTDGLLWDGALVGEGKRATITPQNNRMVIFESRALHAVMPMVAPDDFSKGSFSVSAWVGKYPE